MSSLLNYNPDTGELTWLVSAGRIRSGDVVKSMESQGYLKAKIKGKTYKAHRLAWLLHHGESPPRLIDHINGNRSDNRIANLRLATPAQNSANAKLQSNSTSLLKGVYYVPSKRKWRATVSNQRVIHRLGYFHSKEQAGEAAANKRRELQGEFYRALDQSYGNDVVLSGPSKYPGLNARE